MVNSMALSDAKPIETRMMQAGISGVWLCCTCDTGTPIFVKQHKPKNEMGCTSINCGHMKCSGCDFLGFTDEPSKRFESSERMVEHGDHITLYLSIKERHFKCDVPKTSPDIDAQLQGQNDMGYDPQSSSTIVPFPEFRQYKKRANYNFLDDTSLEAADSESELDRNPRNAPIAISQHREAARTRTTSPEDPTPISNRQPIILPRAKQSSSASDKSSEPPNTIPDNPYSAQQEDWPSEMEQGASIYIQNPARRGTFTTNHMSPGHESRMRDEFIQGIFEGSIVVGRAREAPYSNTYGMFSSTIDTSSHRPVLETTSHRQYYSAHVERLDAESKPAISSSHEIRADIEQNHLPAHENRPQSSISGFAKTVVGTKPSIPATNPTRAAPPTNTASSTSSRLGKRKFSPAIRASQRLPQLQRPLHPKPAVLSSHPASSGPFPAKPPAALPSDSHKSQSIDPLLLEIIRKPYSNAPNPSSNKSITPPNQEVSLQSGEGKLSTPTVLPAKRPVSPAIRVPKVLRRQKPL